MNILLFGATGMIGQGVLRECVLADDVEHVVAITRRTTGKTHYKLREIILPDVAKLSGVETDLANIDACFFCLGVSSAGMSEANYTRLTYDLTLSIARTLSRINPQMRFIYVSGLGTDSSERGRTMWARVKGKTENALLQLPFRKTYMFRPGFIIPLHGVRSSTRWTRILYTATKPFHTVVRAIMPGKVTTSEQLGRAMLSVARNGYSSSILETPDINNVVA